MSGMLHKNVVLKLARNLVDVYVVLLFYKVHDTFDAKTVPVPTGPLNFDSGFARLRCESVNLQ